MIKLKKRIFILITVIVFILTASLPAFAAKPSSKKKAKNPTASKQALSSKLKNAKSQLAQNTANYEKILDEIDKEEATIEILDNKIEDILAKISKTNASIVVAKSNIKKAQQALDKTSKSINSEQGLYNERLRAMYENGPTGYLELLLGSSSFVDFLERYQLTKSIMKFDTQLIGSLQDKKKNIEKQKAILVAQQNNLINLQNRNKANLADLNTQKAKENTLILALQAQKKKYKAAIAEYNRMISATIKAIAELAKKLGNSNSRVYSSDALVVFAARYLGVRYVWGGTTPSGFDCSGFTKYVFAHFGISLNRVSRDQFNQGTYVSKENLKAGDLVFFGRPIHHVGIYVGNNTFIHAPRTGDVVKFSPLTRSDFVGGRRLR